MIERTYLLPFEKPIHELELRLEELQKNSTSRLGTGDDVKRLRREIDELRRKVFANLTAWETVQVARHKDRPQTKDYLELAFDEFVELHGDRAFGDDRALISGFA